MSDALKVPGIVLEHIEGKEITKRLADALEFDPGGTYRLTVRIEDEALPDASFLLDEARATERSRRLG